MKVFIHASTRASLYIIYVLTRNYLPVCQKNGAGLALLRFKQRVVSDPFGALSNWKEIDGEINPCSWFGIECSDEKVVTL